MVGGLVIGIRVGLKVGERVGIAEGIGEDEIASGGPTTLSVALLDSTDPVITFGFYSYLLTVTNTGLSPALTVVATVTLDADTTFVSASGTGWAISQSSGVVTCTRPVALLGASPVVTINVRAPAAAETSSAQAEAIALNAPAATPAIETTVVDLVDRDATKGVYVPSSVAQWDSFLAFFGLTAETPDHMWLCQEALGSLADSIGAMPLSPFITPLYSQAASGWSRLGVAFDAATADRFVAGAGVGPNPNTTSIMMLALTHMDGEAGSFVNLMGLNTTSAVNSVRLNFNPSAGNNRLSLNSNGGNINGTLDHVPGDYAFALQYDKTNTRVSCMSTIERITGVYNATVTDAAKGLGDTASVGLQQIVYAVMWSGSKAEIESADIKALMQALGFTVTGW